MKNKLKIFCVITTFNCSFLFSVIENYKDIEPLFTALYGHVISATNLINENDLLSSFHNVKMKLKKNKQLTAIEIIIFSVLADEKEDDFYIKKIKNNLMNYEIKIFNYTTNSQWDLFLYKFPDFMNYVEIDTNCMYECKKNNYPMAVCYFMHRFTQKKQYYELIKLCAGMHNRLGNTSIFALFCLSIVPQYYDETFLLFSALYGRTENWFQAYVRSIPKYMLKTNKNALQTFQEMYKTNDAIQTFAQKARLEEYVIKQ